MLRWYSYPDPGGSFREAAGRCTAQARGRYRIELVDLPQDPEQQRTRLLTILRARDPRVDLLTLNTEWVAELAADGRLGEWTGQARAAALEDTLAGPRSTTVFRGRTWAVPFTTNPQLLFYRTDRVRHAPRTWDEMITAAERLRHGGKIEVQAAPYEGYTAWISALVASSGGRIVDDAGRPALDARSVRAARIIRRLARSSAAAPDLARSTEDRGRLGFESGRSSFEVNYAFVYASAREARPGLVRHLGIAPWPRVEPGRGARPTLGGTDLGVAAASQAPGPARDAALCLAAPAGQRVLAVRSGLPPARGALYDEPAIRRLWPFADLLRDAAERGAPRPAAAEYPRVSRAIIDAFSPPRAVDPERTIARLRRALARIADGG